MIDYKMFPEILEKIWDGIDTGKVKMDIWRDLTAEERHEINKLTEGDKGEESKALAWCKVQRLYRRELVKHPDVKRAYIRIEHCPSCGYDTEDATVLLCTPYSVEAIERLAKLDLDINLAIRPYYFDVEYKDEDMDLTDYTCFYRKSKRRLEIVDILEKANEMLIAGETRVTVAKAVGVTKQSVSDWMDKDWVSVNRDEHKSHRKEIIEREKERQIKNANIMFSEGDNKRTVSNTLKIGHGVLNDWIERGYVIVPPIREARIQEAVAMALAGKRQVDIAEHFGVAQTTMSARLRKSKEYIRYREERDHSKISMAKKLSHQGITIDEIARTLSASKSTVRRWLEQECV